MIWLVLILPLVGLFLMAIYTGWNDGENGYGMTADEYEETLKGAGGKGH